MWPYPPPPLTQVKPCDIPCPKCGGNDVVRYYHEIHDEVKIRTNGKPLKKYTTQRMFSYYANRNFINNHCRCCHYEWQTLPLKKPRKSKAA